MAARTNESGPHKDVRDAVNELGVERSLAILNRYCRGKQASEKRKAEDKALLAFSRTAEGKRMLMAALESSREQNKGLQVA